MSHHTLRLHPRALDRAGHMDGPPPMGPGPATHVPIAARRLSLVTALLGVVAMAFAARGGGIADTRATGAIATVISTGDEMAHPGVAAKVIATEVQDRGVRPSADTAPDRGPGHRFGRREAPARHAGAIRIGTYNVLNLFDHVDDPALSGQHDDIAMATGDDRCRGLARAIRALDADILALEEVESLEALTWFRDTYLQGMGYDHVASRDVGYYRGVECSILSRYPVENVRSWPELSLDGLPREGPGWAAVPAGERLRFQRSPLCAEIVIRPDYRVKLFVVHHKSGRDFDHHREAEALMINELIDQARRAMPRGNIIVLGDFNAAPWDKSLRVYLENGLVDTMAHRTTDNRASESDLYRTHESRRVLDYILLDGTTFAEFIPGSAFVLGTLHPGDDYDFRTDVPPPGYAADHYPVAIELVPADQP